MILYTWIFLSYRLILLGGKIYSCHFQDGAQLLNTNVHFLEINKIHKKMKKEGILIINSAIILAWKFVGDQVSLGFLQEE